MGLIKRILRHFFIFLLGLVQNIIGVLIAIVLIVIPIIKISEFLGSFFSTLTFDLVEKHAVYGIWGIAGLLFIILSYQGGEETIKNYKREKEGTLAGFIKKKIRQFKEE